MKKSTTISLLRLGVVALVVMFSGLCMMAVAQPKITGYYPASGMELAKNTNAYVYFDATVTYAKAHVIQNGQVLGSCIYKQTGTPRVAMVKALDAENSVLAEVAPGEFTLEFYEISYPGESGNEVITSDDTPFGSVTYNRKGENGKIVSESGFPGNLIKSYYAEDDNDALKVFTFNKPVVTTGIRAYYQYGSGNSYFDTPVPCSISSDGLTLTIDVRGQCYNADRLAPGFTFLDDEGNVTTPPSSIILLVEGLKCQDESNFVCTVVSPDGRTSVDLKGQIFQNYSYKDLTFPNPVIDKAEFYAKANPSDRFINITEDVDMIDLFVSNSEYISSCDIKLATPNNEYVIPASAITVKSGVYSAALPAGAIAEGSAKMMISLENVVFTQFDGSQHVIRPLDLSHVAIEVLSLADLKKVEPGTDVVISIAKGLVVTLSNDMGYTFAEDGVDGIQIVTEDYSKVLDEGMCLMGKVAGKYLGGGMFMIDVDASDYTVAGADIYMGEMVDDIADILSGAYDNRLVTIVNSEDMPITVYPGGEAGEITESILIMTEFIEDYTLPETVENITGVLYKDSGIDKYYLLLRNDDDVDKEISGVRTVKSIEKLVALPMGTEVVLKVSGAKVTYSNEDRMMCFLEDETGAILCGDMYGDGLLAPEGKALTGNISGLYYGQNMFIFNASESSYTVTDADVSKGSNIRPETASDPSNIYRLVTFENTPETPFEVGDYQISIGNLVAAVDYFEVFDYDFVMPTNVKSFTGIIMPNIYAFDLMDEPTEQPALVAFRSGADIELYPEVAGDIDGDGKVSIGDVVAVCNLILSDDYLEAADLDHNGNLSVGDIVALVNIILSVEN